MVQVDVFWSYGIGAGFALANTWQLEVERKEARSPFDHRSFRDNVLFLSTVFVPSGICLLWAFTSWETMHVGNKTLPGRLVTLFAVTNVTQGLLGYAVTAWLMRRGRRYLGYLQWVLGYFGMFFILVHGWDGSGYQRFFSATAPDLDGWTWATAARWLTSDVSLTLAAMGVVLLPSMLGPMGRALAQGYAISDEVTAPGRTRSAWVPALSVLLFALTGVLGSAILFSLGVRSLGPWAGTLVSGAVLYAAFLRPGTGVFYRHFRHLVFAEPTVTWVPAGRGRPWPVPSASR